MSVQNHPWCRDVQRDEAIRRAEDAAAAELTPLPDHRDLPQAVAGLRERVARMEDLFFDANEMVTPPQPAPVPPADGRAICHIDTTDTIDERGWDEPVAPRMDRADGCRVGAVYPRPAAAGGADGASGAGDRGAAVSGLRTERVTLEVTHRSPVSVEGWALHSMLSLEGGESVRVVEETHFDDLAQVSMERNAAREECERLRARVAELEAAPAANAGGVSNPEPISGDGKTRGSGNQEPVLYGVLWEGRPRVESWDVRDTEEQAVRLAGTDGTVVPLYAAPQPPRGWLTEEDCAALYLARAVLDGVFVGSWQEKHDAARRLVGIRERAIREAGGEVE